MLPFSRDLRHTFALFALPAMLLAGAALGQEPAPASETVPKADSQQPASTEPVLPKESGDPTKPAVNASAPVDKRAFGVLPNYRTAEAQAPFQPLTVKQKFTIATKDSFDYPVILTTALFAGQSQLTGSNNEVYGQGAKGFVHRLGISYADQIMGNYFPEAIVPSLFHTDPRYFRKGEGSFKGRAWYAVSRIFVCKNDSGNWTFNVNEFVGNSAAAIVASSYHPHERTPGDMAVQASNFIESDLAGQLLKEFWPDVKRWYHNRHH